jgi:hypothetical protein
VLGRVSSGKDHAGSCRSGVAGGGVVGVIAIHERIGKSLLQWRYLIRTGVVVRLAGGDSVLGVPVIRSLW